RLVPCLVRVRRGSGCDRLGRGAVRQTWGRTAPGRYRGTFTRHALNALSVERVFDDLPVESAVRPRDQANDRVADRALPAGQQPVLGGGRCQRAPLARADRLGRGPKGLTAPRLHLDDHQLAASAADEVYLAPPGGEAGATHLVPSTPPP